MVTLKVRKKSVNLTKQLPTTSLTTTIVMHKCTLQHINIYMAFVIVMLAISIAIKLFSFLVAISIKLRSSPTTNACPTSQRARSRALGGVVGCRGNAA
jgi:hypothetical protein